MTISQTTVERIGTKESRKKVVVKNAANLKSGIPENPMERRRFVRVSADLIGLVECKGQFSTAYVRDISSNGAHLFFVDRLPAGSVHSIVIPRLNQRLVCDTVWRRGRSIGIQFKERPYEIAQKMPVPLRERMLPAA